MSLRSASTWFLVSALLWGVLGCGGAAPASPAGSTADDVAAANLNGNWLIAGTLPQEPVTTPESFGLAMSFTTTGNQILGSGVSTYMCGGEGGGLSFGGLLRGSVAADGSFTAQTPADPTGALVSSLSVTGTVPKTPGGAWTGRYTVQCGPFPFAESCLFNQSGDFSATAIPAVAGTYVGTGTSGLGSTEETLKITLQLQQGETVSSANGTVFDALLLTGSVQVEGSSCLHSGKIGVPGPTTTPSTSVGEVEGDQVIASFTMDDGSSLRLYGSLADTQGSRILLPFLVVEGGTCEASPQGIRIKEFDRVP